VSALRSGNSSPRTAIAQATHESAIVDPTDRSIPPVTTTNVIPTAATAMC